MDTTKSHLTAQELALYIGQECEADLTSRPCEALETARGKILGVIEDSGYCELSVLNEDPDDDRMFVLRDYELPAFAVKPLLRPISSLTEEEARECYRIVWGRAWPTEPDDWHKHHTPSEPYTCLDAWWNDVPDGGFEVSFARHHKGSPAVWRYLLSIGIDLFGFIAAGKALDKTKLQNDEQ